jgi:hypothetical protein
VPREALPDLLQWIEKERQRTRQTPADFVSGNGHRLHRILRQIYEERLDRVRMVNFEGDPITFCTADYEVRDEPEVLRAFRAMPQLSEASPGPAPSDAAVFDWIDLEQSKDGSRKHYGMITVQAAKLRLETESENRLSSGRDLLESHAGAWLKHVKDTVVPQDEVKPRAVEGPKRKASHSIPPDVEQEIIGKALQDHYSRWVDQPLPALDGRTPREAARTEKGRREVEELLRGIENREERNRADGRPAFDVSSLRTKLGMHG